MIYRYSGESQASFDRKVNVITIGGVAFGVAESPVFSGNTDAVFIRRTNSTFTPTTYISGFNLSLCGGRVTSLPVGTTVYSKGYASGCQTGEVIDISLDTAYGITDCVITTNVCAEGDSGGIVFITHQGNQYVAGIITGRTNIGTAAYVKIVNLMDSIDVTIYY